MRYTLSHLGLGQWGVYDTVAKAHLCQDWTTNFSVAPANLTWGATKAVAQRCADKFNKREEAFAAVEKPSDGERTDHG